MSAMDAASLQFRRIEPGDTDAIHALHSDPATNRYNPYGASGSVEASQALLEEWIAHWQEHGFGYELVEYEGALVGICGVRVDRWRELDVRNLYWRLMPAFQGMGLAATLARRALGQARATESGQPIVARMLPGNAASARVAEGLGMQRAPQLDGALGGADWILYVAPDQAAAADSR